MKKVLPAAALAFSALWAAAPARAVVLDATPFTIVGNSSAPAVTFGLVMPGQRFFAPQDYVRVQYPPADTFNPFRILRWPRPPRFLRLYTKNPPWAGQSGQFNGLLRTDLTSRVPLFWRAFNGRQPGGPPFNAGTAGQWTQVRDPRDANWLVTQFTALLPTYGAGETFVYLGADGTSFGAGAYSSPLVFEFFSQVADTSLPTITHIPWHLVNDLLRRLLIVCNVDEDVDVADAVLQYRMQGAGNPWKSLPFGIEDDPSEPFIFHLKAAIPPADLAEGTLEYWFSVSDGEQETLFGSAAAPQTVTLSETASADMTTAGGRIDYLDGVSSDGTTSLFFPAGALRKDARISLRRRPSSLFPHLPAAPPIAGAPPAASPWPVLEITSSDEGVSLRKQAMLTFVYDDLDGDGLVDGTGADEKNLRLFRFDGIDWRPLGGTVDASLKAVQAPIEAFGLYALLPGSVALDTLKPREKILTPALQDGVNDFAFFDGAGPGSTIRIFDVRGHLVREIRDLGVWDARDVQGNIVESGVYVYQVESGGRKTAGTITVAK